MRVFRTLAFVWLAFCPAVAHEGRWRCSKVYSGLLGCVSLLIVFQGWEAPQQRVDRRILNRRVDRLPYTVA